MKISLLCNCGLAVEVGGKTLLIDALNEELSGFAAIPKKTAEKIIAGAPPFSHIAGVVFTHWHPDHYSPALAARFAAENPQIPIFVPETGTPENGVLFMDGFRVEFSRFPHSGEQYREVIHCVFQVFAGERLVYIAGDADWLTARHRALLAGQRADAAFFNPIYVAKDATRDMLRKIAVRSYIYHIPPEGSDETGIRRKCLTSFRRHPAELESTIGLFSYPQELEIAEGVR